MQLDILSIDGETVLGNLYAEARVVRILMTKADYMSLIRDGFFIRDGQTQDSAGVINTTREYSLIDHKKPAGE